MGTQVGVNLGIQLVLFQCSFKLECEIYQRWFLLSVVDMTISSTISPLLKISLRLLGIWPGVSRSILYTYMSSILIIQYFQYLYISTNLKLSELSNLVDGLMSSLVYSLTFLKLISLRIRCP